MKAHFLLAPLLLMAPLADAAWRLGVWWELGEGRDSLQASRFAEKLSKEFDRKLRASGGRGAMLVRLVLVPAGGLPLAGRDPQEHPDLRDSAVDLEWGVPLSKPVPEFRAVEETWLRALGCPDPSTFGVGWDLFRVQEGGKPLLGSPAFPLLQGLWAHLPSWALVDSAVDSLCVSLSQADTAPRGPRLARQLAPQELLARVIPDTISVQVTDGAGHPVAATLDLWRSSADPLRPYAARFDGLWDTLRTDSLGRLRLRREAWFRGPMVHGRQGSNLQTLARIRGQGRRTAWTWLEARDVALAQGRMAFRLPAGTSAAWRRAASSFPQTELLVVESDSIGVWVGLSLLNRTDLVLRLSEPGGRELFRSERLALEPGAWERRLPVVLGAGGGYELRMDTPTSRRLVRFVAGAGTAER